LKKSIFIVSIFILLFLQSYPIFSQTWQPLGPSDLDQVSANSCGSINMTFYGSVPYVAFYSGKAAAIQVRKKAANGAGWERVGRDIQTNGIAGTNISLAVNNSRIYIVYTAGYVTGSQVTVKRLNADGSDWELVGNEGFSTGQANDVSIAFNGTVPYVAFEDEANGAKLTVMKLNTAGTSWEVVGKAGFSADKIYYTSIAFNGAVPYVAYSEGSNLQAKVIKLNAAGTDWEQLGKSVSVYPVAYFQLAFNGATPYVAFEEARQKATVKKLNAAGSDWETVGTAGFTPGIASNVLLAFNSGVPYVAYADGANNSKVSVMKLNPAGTGWTGVGQTGISAGSVNFLAFGFNGVTPYLAFPDNGYLSKPRVMKLNDAGTAWEQLTPLGISAGFSWNVNIKLNGNIPYLVYRDNTYSNKASVMRYNLSKAAWENVGNPGFTFQLSDITQLPIAFSGTIPYVAFIDGSLSGKATVMKLNSAGTGWEAAGPAGFSSDRVTGQVSLAVNGSTPYIMYFDKVLNIKKLNAAGTAWASVGNAFTAGPVNTMNTTSIVFKGAVPYIGFADAGHNGRVTVMKLGTSGTWEPVGPPGFAGSEYFSLVFSGDTPYVVCTDNSGHKIALYRLKADGTAWETVGGVSSSDASSTYVSLTFDGDTPYISAVYNNHNARVMTLDAAGKSWQPVGGYSVSATDALSSAITIIDHKLYLAYDSYGAFVKTYSLAAIQSAAPLNAAQGNTVTITGSNFTGTTSVSFGGVPARSFKVISSTSITAEVPYNAGSGNIQVTTPANIASIKGFVFLPAPVISSFTPVSGAKNTAVTITGSNFIGATAVKFGGIPAASFVVNSATSISATTGTGATGQIAVTTPGGTVLSASPFSYLAAPVINTFSPTQASAGTTIHIIGSGFTGVAAVNIGGVPIQSFTVNSATDISAVVPANAISGKISVTTGGGTVASAGTFTFVVIPPPVISSFTPTQAIGTTQIIITGSGFTGATSVTFGGVQATRFSVYSDTQIAAVVSTTGASGDVVVSTPAGAGALKGFVFLKPPQISSFNPSVVTEGTVVTINGQGFTAAMGVSFGNTTATSFSIISDTKITATAGKGASGTVYVSTPGGGATADGFVFLSKPVISPSGPVNLPSGDSVTLRTNAPAGSTYQWTQDGKVVSQDDHYLATGAGTYIVKVSNGGISLSSDPVTVKVVFKLPADNFKVSATSVTCKGEHNGSIQVTAKQSLNYTLTVTGSGLNQSYAFSNNVSAGNLPPGTYDACITVAGQPDYQQCFELVISQPDDLSVFSSVNKATNSLNLTLNGSDQYAVVLNGTTYNTTESSMTLPLHKGNNTLLVVTDKPCQGTIEKTIGITDHLSPYPNPFQDILNVNLGDGLVARCIIAVYNIADGRLLYKQQLSNRSGVVQIALTGLKNGTYSLNMSLDNRESVYKIIKK
jgi:hypothetical protein